MRHKYNQAQLEFQSTPPVKAATDVVGNVFREYRFQSTPPVKAATPSVFASSRRKRISIHAAREGGDLSCSSTDSCPRYFNPRRP